MTEKLQRDLAQELVAHLAANFRRAETLSQLAAVFDHSPGHLCRVFFRHTGRRIHAYRDQLRLRASLEEVMAGKDLAEIALDLGYCSHSHFTSAFRRAFSTVPTAVRRQAARAGLAGPRTRDAHLAGPPDGSGI